MRNKLMIAGVAALWMLLPIHLLGAVCTLSVSGVAYGSYDSLGSTDRETTGSITATCTGSAGEQVSYTITATTGTGTYGSRQLEAADSQLEYNLYVDPGHISVFGDGTDGSSVLADFYTLGEEPTSKTYFVYGRIDGGQHSAKASSYSDSLVVMLNY